MITIITQYGELLLRAMGQTLLLALCGLFFACIIGLVFGMMSVLKSKVCRAIAQIFVDIVRGVPMIVLAFFVFFGVPYFFKNVLGNNITLSALTAGTICLALNCGAYMAEIIRAGIESVDKGQMEACLSCGMTTGQAYRRVVLPQAFHLAVPSLMNNFIECFKGTALVSMVGVTDMMLTAKMLTARNLRFVEGYLAVLLLYWVINMVFVAIQKRLELRLDAKY